MWVMCRSPCDHLAGRRSPVAGQVVVQGWTDTLQVDLSDAVPTATVAGQAGAGTTGTITRQVERIDSRNYRVGLRVTGTRSFASTSVRLTYSCKHRISRAARPPGRHGPGDTVCACARSSTPGPVTQTFSRSSTGRSRSRDPARPGCGSTAPGSTPPTGRHVGEARAACR